MLTSHRLRIQPGMKWACRLGQQILKRGQLLSETLYSSTNNIVQQNEYTYTRLGFAVETNFSRSLRKDFGGYCIILDADPVQTRLGIMTSEGWQIPQYHGALINPNSFTPYYTIGTAYGHYSYKFLKDKVTQSNYPQGVAGSQAVVTDIQYQYGPMGQPVKNHRNQQ